METDQVPSAVRGAQPPRTHEPSNNKRLFSDYEKEHRDIGDDGEPDPQSVPNTAEKRRRASLWPFHGRDNVDASAAKRRGKKSGSAAMRARERNARSSRFVEGSMNNRASKKPPQEHFAGYEEPQSEKDESSYVNRHSRKPSQAAMMLKEEFDDEFSAEVDTNRKSTIFKFGKSLAATFNPAKWKIWQKPQPVEDVSAAERLKADAEFKRAYEEVKKRGYIQGNRPGELATAERSKMTLNSEELSDTAMEEGTLSRSDFAHEENQDPRNRGHTSADYNPTVNPPILSFTQSELEKKYARSFPKRLPAVKPEDSISNVGSPSSDTPNRGPSQLLLGAFRDDPHRPTVPIDNYTEWPEIEGRGAKPLTPKERKKQMALVHKVSSLESQLRQAREELAVSMGLPPPPPKTYGPIDYGASRPTQEEMAQNGVQSMNGAAGSVTNVARTSFAAEALEKEHSMELSSRHELSGEFSPGQSSPLRNSRHSPLATSEDVESLPHTKVSESMQITELEHKVPGAGSDLRSNIQTTGGHEMMTSTAPQHMTHMSSTRKIMSRIGPDGKYLPFQAVDEDESDGTNSIVARTATIKRMNSGPKRRQVEVVQVVSKIRSVKGRIRTMENSRTLEEDGQSENEGGFASPARSRTPSEVSVKSTRSSRIPRPSSPLKERGEKIPPVPIISVDKIEQASMIPKRSTSTKSFKAGRNDLAVKVTEQLLKTPPVKDTKENRRKSAPAHVKVAGQSVKTPPRNVSKASTPTTPTDGRGKSTNSVRRKASSPRKLPSLDSSRSLKETQSVRGRTHDREREMSPSKEGTFEWGPDVF